MQNEFMSLSAGERTACDGFVRAEYAGLYRWFLWLTNCPHRAADLTQETFTAFWDSLRRSTPGTSPRNWLFAIGRNQWRKDLRDRKSHESSGEEFSEELLDELCASGCSPVEMAQLREFTAALESEVARLPADFREVLVLRLWQEFDYDDIGAVQGIKPELARWRFFRARQILRARLRAFCLQEHGHGQ